MYDLTSRVLQLVNHIVKDHNAQSIQGVVYKRVAAQSLLEQQDEDQ